MIPEFRQASILIRNLERGAEELIENYNKLIDAFEILRKENEELKQKLEEYDKCKTESEESTQEVS